MRSNFIERKAQLPSELMALNKTKAKLFFTSELPWLQTGSPLQRNGFHRTKGIISHLELEGGEGWDGGFHKGLIMNLEHPSPVCTWAPEGAARSLFNFT